MEQNNNKDEVIELKGEFRIRLGIILILASPLLGIFLSWISTTIVGMLISTEGAANIVLITSILAVIIVGILEVILGINEKNKV